MTTGSQTIVPRGNANLAPGGNGKGTIKDYLLSEAFTKSLQQSATRHLSAEKLIRAVLAQISRVPKLAQCTPMSIMQAVQACSQLGLAPGPLGHAYFVPYDNRKAGITECQLIVGYTGLMT